MTHIFTALTNLSIPVRSVTHERVGGLTDLDPCSSVERGHELVKFPSLWPPGPDTMVGGDVAEFTGSDSWHPAPPPALLHIKYLCCNTQPCSLTHSHTHTGFLVAELKLKFDITTLPKRRRRVKWNADVSEVPGFRSRFTNLQQSAHAHAHAHALKHNFTFSRKKICPTWHENFSQVSLQQEGNWGCFTPVSSWCPRTSRIHVGWSLETNQRCEYEREWFVSDSDELKPPVRPWNLNLFSVF